MVVFKNFITQYSNKTLENYLIQGLPLWFVILWKPRMPTKTVHGVRNMICVCSLGMAICDFTFRMNFELRGWPPQPPTFSSNSSKITKNAQF